MKLNKIAKGSYMINLVRVASFGRDIQQDRKYLRYINRYGTAEDAMGNPVNINKQLALHDTRTSKSAKISTRLSISLPKAHTQQAYDIVRDMLLQRYGAFVTALHSDKGNPHMHVYIQNLDRLSFSKLWDKDIFNAEFQKRLQEQGITYSFQSHRNAPKRSQSEIHILERGERSWKHDMRESVSKAVTQATSVETAIQAIQAQCITIARETENNLVFQDMQGNKARLGTLYTQWKSRKDIENYYKGVK